MASRVVTSDGVPNEMAEIPAVELVGASMLALVEAIPEFEARTGRRATVIGGLAVLCRLGTVYRVTGDLDTANRRAAGEPPQLDVLLQQDDVIQADPAGVLIPTSAGWVKVDVIEVSDAELAQLPEDETDRLAVLSHAWAIETATPLRIRAASPDGAGTEVVAHVAEPGPLIAMKLQSVMNRTVNKERTDLLDMVRLTLDHTASATARAQLAEADTQLAEDARLHARRWFVERKDQTLRLIRELPEGAGVDADDVQLVGELLLAELDRPWPSESPGLGQVPADGPSESTAGSG
jgi:hypothetical protein